LKRGAPTARPKVVPPKAAPALLSLARALSKFGVCSRKEAVGVIEAGRVRVGGRIVRSPASRIDPRHDRVRVDDEAVGDETERVVFAFHKPKGYITTRTDPGQRATVYDLLGDVGRWVFPVGRLDRDTRGLLVLTNDHRLGERLTDPAHHVPKTYHVKVRGLPDDEALRALKSGLPLEAATLTRPARVRVLGAARGGSTWLEIVLTEGKNRQVRRMCSAVGHEVEELVRVGIGGLALGDLPTGEWRRLGKAEVEALQRVKVGSPRGAG
jgi:23S rRNA pseudouridine2605 synthase